MPSVFMAWRGWGGDCNLSTSGKNRSRKKTATALMGNGAATLYFSLAVVE
jgi:hypothetical protein